MTGIWTHRFEVVMRPLRDLGAAPTTVVIETRTAAQAGRDAVTLHPEMKVLSVSRASATVTEARAAGCRDVVVPLKRAAGQR
jgi:hypothetical protein